MAFFQALNFSKKRFFYPAVILISLFCADLYAGEPTRIRVAVARDAIEVNFSVSGPHDIVDIRENNVLSSNKNSSHFSVTGIKGGLKVGGSFYATDAISIDAKNKAAIVVGKRRYRGDISVFKDAAGKLCVVNTLEIEPYIKGVLYNEIFHKWPIDAIKAQAVAVRTYAMYQKEVMKDKDYDVASDTSSQVYGGYDSETDKTNRAADFTDGEVLLYRNRLFPSYFHATCGGITENAAELWKIDIGPLSGCRVCGFCSGSPHYFWKTRMDLAGIREKLGARYTLKGGLVGISVIERNMSGRVRLLELKDSFEDRLVVSAKDLRSILGPDILRSTNFSIILENGRLIFAGKGWGHGAGLCQWGAFGMAKKGISYKQILEFYYPGAVITKIN